VSTNESPAISTQRGSTIADGVVVVVAGGVVDGVVVSVGSEGDVVDGVVLGSDASTGLWEVGAPALSARHPTIPRTRAHTAAVRPSLRVAMRRDYFSGPALDAISTQTLGRTTILATRSDLDVGSDFEDLVGRETEEP
jgi:hypothetical protein